MTMRVGQTEDATVQDALDRMERRWNESALLRRIYRDWYAMVASRLAEVPGPVVELGSGIGKLREQIPDLVRTDVEPTRWADRVVDGTALPFEDGGVANLVLIDVFHHLGAHMRFLDEAARVLAPGGRLILLEPYCSRASTVAYRLLHAEPVDRSAPPFEDAAPDGSSPWDANIALPTIVFFEHAREFEERWPRLRIVERRLLSTLVYPLSGGYTGRPLLPAAAYTGLARLDTLLARRHGTTLAFRCLVVVEASR